MSGKRINYRLVKQYRNYTVDEIARLLCVHKNTVRDWIAKGLPVIGKSKPLLVLGSDLKDWHAAKRKSAKRPCGPGQFFCFKCKQPKRPALGMVDYIPKTDRNGCLKALCETCECPINRNANVVQLSAIMPGIAIQFVERQSSISGRAELPSNCDLK